MIDLMAPRYICTGNGEYHYPGSKNVPGNIIGLKKSFKGHVIYYYISSSGHTEEYYNDYPHLFKRLHWSEYREKNELPKYVKYTGTGEVREVENWDVPTNSSWFMYLKGDSRPYSPSGSSLEKTDWQPATKKEYITFITLKNKPHETN